MVRRDVMMRDMVNRDVVRRARQLPVNLYSLRPLLEAI